MIFSGSQKQLNTLNLVRQRLTNEWKLMLSIFSGVLIATTLISGAPIYLDSLERISVNTAFDRTSDVTLNALIYTPNIVLTRESLEESQQKVNTAVQEHIDEVYVDERRLIRSQNYLAGLPYRPLETRMVSRGYLQFMEDIDQNIVFVEGEMASDEIKQGESGPLIEVIIGSPSLNIFDVKVNDVIELTTFIDSEITISAKITGIFDPVDSKSPYWRENSDTFLKPAPLEDAVEQGVMVDPEEPPLPFFVTENTLIDSISNSFPGTLVSSSWLLFLDRENLKKYDVQDGKLRFANFREDISLSLPGSFILSIVPKVLETYETRSLYTSIPLLLLLTLMIVTVLYYMSMMISYLVQSREEDVVRLRTRGISTFNLFRVYLIEILVIIIGAIVIGPFIAMGLIASAGKLPYFDAITSGDFIPVQLTWQPFVIGAALGVLCLAIYTIAGLIAARAGVISQRLKASRPQLTPFFQRYYIDIAFLIIGGIVFWELQSRGSFLSSNSANVEQINEGLLFAPVLFLIGIALIFMRVFPLVIRYFAGESISLANLITFITLIMIIPVYSMQQFLDQRGFNWLYFVLIGLAFLICYRWTIGEIQSQQRRKLWILIGLTAQVLFVATYVYLSQTSLQSSYFLYEIIISFLIAIVPLQILFIVLRYTSNSYPVWISISLWHMARNPFQYSWLVLLLVLITGMAVLSTTVGGTLDKSQLERVLHKTASDVRVTGLPLDRSRGIDQTREYFQDIEGVSESALAYRGVATPGSTGAGFQFDVLAVQPEEFKQVSWFREDYAEIDLVNLMIDLQEKSDLDQLQIPENSKQIGVHVKPEENYPNIFVWLIVEDGRGFVRTITLGRTQKAQWQQLKADIPENLVEPISIISVQIYEPVLGANGSIGSMQFDDIFVTDEAGLEKVIEGFEGPLLWRTLVSTPLATHQLSTNNLEPNSGERNAEFQFGKDTSEGIRGFYYAPSGGQVPVIINESLSLAAGIELSDNVLVTINGQVIPIKVIHVINNFPTLRSDRGFLIGDLSLMLRVLKIKATNSIDNANELFLSVDPDSTNDVVNKIYEILGRADPIRIYDKNSSLSSNELDPLVSGGWKSMVMVAIFVVIFTGALGYSTYLLSFSGRSNTQMASLRTLGLSRAQMMGLLYLENIVIFALGMGLGTWAGFQMSALMVDSVAVTETGNKVMPVFQIVTNWKIMWPVYGILTMIFVTAVLFMYRAVIKVDLPSMSRRVIN
tara:strand:+ start:21214 stop:24903 length:3690 start_codon:yes stop_codon:yes gene_type:complete